jgi:tRNA 2-thiouridine synthesizing protein A
MSEKIDARGLSCPQPVVLTARAIEAGRERFEVWLDTEVSCENVERFARSKGFTVDRDETDDGVILTVRR